MKKEKSLTRKQLVKLTGAKPYTIADSFCFVAK